MSTLFHIFQWGFVHYSHLLVVFFSSGFGFFPMFFFFSSGGMSWIQANSVREIFQKQKYSQLLKISENIHWVESNTV